MIKTTENNVGVKPAGNKSRFGNRGAKLRYSVFRAQRNQKWLPVEEKEFYELCEKYGLDPDKFIKESDNPNRKWSYACHRARKAIYNSSGAAIEVHRESFRKRPGMYLGQYDMDRFEVFVNTTGFIEDLNNVPEEDRFFPVDWISFSQFVWKKTSWERPDTPFGIAKELCLKEGGDSVKLWLSWYDEFQEEEAKKVTDNTTIE